MSQTGCGGEMSESSRTLSREAWLAAQRKYRERIETLLMSHPPTLNDGSPHPVWSFLFTYYSYRRSALRRWHPGAGVVLRDAPEFSGRSGYHDLDPVSGRRVTVTPAAVRRRRGTVEFVTALLRATTSRKPQFGCFGLHEWAMVYRTGDIRHSSTPLRLGAEETNTVVESLPLRCTHFDAYRFFADEAVGRNELRLTRNTQLASEQPACVHAGMDLYKWATKLTPLLPGDLIADTFELALDLRELDMRASPYDLTSVGMTAIPIETPAGRAEYARRQAALADRAAVVRMALLAVCTTLATAG